MKTYTLLSKSNNCYKVRSLPRRNENRHTPSISISCISPSEAYLEGMKTQQGLRTGLRRWWVRSLPRRNENSTNLMVCSLARSVRSLPRRNENRVTRKVGITSPLSSEAYLEGMKTRIASTEHKTRCFVRSLPRRNENNFF